MNQWFQQQSQVKAPKPKRKLSEKALARIQKRTQKFKSGEVKNTRNKNETVNEVSVSEPMDIESSSSPAIAGRLTTSSTQTDPVLVFDLPLIDPTKAVIKEDKILSKNAFYKKYKAEILAKKETFLLAKETMQNVKDSASL